MGYQFKNITNAEVNNLLLEDLIIWTNYEIEVAAYNSAGLGVYSMKVTEWTLQGGRQGQSGVGRGLVGTPIATGAIGVVGWEAGGWVEVPRGLGCAGQG